MPNKDSFTFSDKLRKSKSVPLSKRLPSIVGGQNKQKRTLVQRAQRDLPFILVAACALLLLPFLSKNGSDDIAAPGELNWGAAQEEPSYAEGGGADIMPAGAMTDPLDLILRPRNAVEEPALKPEEATRNAYRSPYDNDRDSSYRRSTTPRSSYDDRADYDRKYSDKASKPSTIEKFGKKTRPSVRNSIVRKGTEINRALRVSQMPSGKGGTGVSHALPLGQGPANVSSPSGPNPGVRPIALQPMEARGTVGRSLTGENLYAEAARSINAMNAGRGAKANLLAAQMKDVDGTLTPMGAGGSFGGGGSARPGAGGGGPNNTNGYHIDKPWWWDMMQKRSQMWWELFQYKWREMLWTNIYDIVFNGGKQIVNCLLFGSKDVDVSHMFGASSGSPDYVCVKDGKEIPEVGSAKDFAGDFSNKTQSGTRDGNSEERTDTGSSWESYVRFCASYGGKPAKSENSDDGFFKVRGKCLGLNILAKKIRKWAAAKDYQGNCDGVNNDPMSFTYTVTKNGDERTRLEKKTVIALVAELKKDKVSAKKNANRAKNRTEQAVKNGSQIIVYAQMGNVLKKDGSDIADEFINQNKYPFCELKKLVAFVPRDNRLNVRSDIAKMNKEQANNFWRYQGQIKSALSICEKGENQDVQPVYLEEYRESLWDYKYDVREEVSDSGVKKDSYKECTIYTKENRPGIGDKKIGDVQCTSNTPTNVSIAENRYYSATIKNPEPDRLKVYAILAEQIDGQTTAKIVYTARMDAHNTKHIPNSNMYTYSFYTLAGGSKGLNPNQKDQEVVSNYGSSNKSNSNSVDNVDANAKSSAIYTQANTNMDNQCTTCQQRLAQLDLNSDAYKTQADLCKTICHQNVVNFAGNSNSSSSGSEQSVARGNGRVYWILSSSDDLKIKDLDDLDKTLNRLKASDLVENIVSSDYCEYYWCDIGSCGAPPAITDGLCIQDGQAYGSVQYGYNGGILNIKVGNTGTTYQGSAKLEDCTDVCYDATTKDNDVFILKNGEKTNDKIGTLKDIGLNTDAVEPCPAYCTDIEDRLTYPAKIVNINKEPHYIRTSLESTSVQSNGPCSYAAWIMENNAKKVVLLDAKWNKLPIMYDQDKQRRENIYEANKTLFDDLIDNCLKTSEDPVRYELLPQMMTDAMQQARKEIGDNCNGTFYASYDSASIVPNKDEELQAILEKVNNCFNGMENLEKATELETPRTIYVYGYASNEGNENMNCDLKKQAGPLCNFALSEDRNLYLISKIAESNADVYVERDTTYTANEYNGFSNTNTKVNGTPTKGVELTKANATPSRRYKFTEPSGSKFKIVSVPCGSTGANHDSDPGKDRYIAISLKGPESDEDYCENRLNEENLKNQVACFDGIVNNSSLKLKPFNKKFASLSVGGQTCGMPVQFENPFRVGSLVNYKSDSVEVEGPKISLVQMSDEELLEYAKNLYKTPTPETPASYAVLVDDVINVINARTHNNEPIVSFGNDDITTKQNQLSKKIVELRTHISTPRIKKGMI